MKQASASTTPTATKTKIGTTSNPWVSPYANLTQDEFRKMILMGKRN